MKLVIDYIGSQSINGVSSHGGANYTKKILQEVWKRKPSDVEIVVIWPKEYKPVDSIEEWIYTNYELVEMKEIDDSLDLKAGDVLFFPLLRTRRYPILKKIRDSYPEIRIYLTNHDVRPLDEKPDNYSKFYFESYNLFFGRIKYHLKAVLYKCYIKKYYKYLDKLFTVSNDAMQKITKIAKVKQINYYYEETLISNQPIENCFQDEYILFVSGKVQTKNFARALEAFCRYKEITNNSTYLYVTGMTDDMFERIKKNPKVNQTVVNKWVKTFSYVETQVLHDLYAQCLYLLYPSLNEGFGLPILEAAICGKRALASYISAIPEIVGSIGYYINPFSVEDITQGMIHMESRLDTDELFLEKVRNNLRNSEIDMEMLIRELLN